MSRRARAARHLSTILTAEAHTWVLVRYYPQDRRYGVQWSGGPSAAQMYDWATQHADEIPELDVNALVWLRTEPSVPPARR